MSIVKLHKLCGWELCRLPGARAFAGKNSQRFRRGELLPQESRAGGREKPSARKPRAKKGGKRGGNKNSYVVSVVGLEPTRVHCTEGLKVPCTRRCTTRSYSLFQARRGTSPPRLRLIEYASRQGFGLNARS